MGCALDNVYADIMYTPERATTEDRLCEERNALQQFKRLFIQRDTAVIPLR